MAMAPVGSVEQFAETVITGRHVRWHPEVGAGGSFAAGNDELLMIGWSETRALNAIDCGHRRWIVS